MQTELLTEASDLLSDMKVALAALIEATDKASAMGGGREQAEAYHGVVAPAMEALRAPADRLEMIVEMCIRDSTQRIRNLSLEFLSAFAHRASLILLSSLPAVTDLSLIHI